MTTPVPGAAQYPLPGDEPAGRHRLPARTIKYWRVRAAINGVVAVAATLAVALFLDWPAAPVRWVLAAVALGYLLVGTTIAPVIRWRVFWYAVDAAEIEIQRGLVVVSRTVIPMSRVQHLKSEHGPLADRFRLAAVHIHTAAGTVEMHALDAEEADELRRQIGRLANLADDV